METTAANKSRAYWKILFSVRLWLFLLGGGLVAYAFDSGDDTALFGYRFRWGMYYILAGLVLWILIRLTKIIFKPEYYNYEHNVSDMKFYNDDGTDFSGRPYVCIAGIDLKETVYYTIVVLVKLVVFISLAAFSWERYHYEPLPSYAQPEMILKHFAKPIEEIHKIAQKLKPDVYPDISKQQKQLFRSYPHIRQIRIEDNRGCGLIVYERENYQVLSCSYPNFSSLDDFNKPTIVYVTAGTGKWRDIYFPGVIKRPGLPDVKYKMFVDDVHYDRME